MGILAWIVLGGLAGWLAGAVTGKQQGCALNVVIGIAGAVIGGMIFSFLGGAGITGFNVWSIIVAFVGALVLLAIINAVRRNA